MARRPLPPLPKPLTSVGSSGVPEAARRVDEWARGAQTLLDRLRAQMAETQAALDALTAEVAAGGDGAAVTFGSPVALTPGGTNVDGASGDVADAEHEHELPPFGDASGEFCEGDDPRLDDDRVAHGLRTATTVVDVSAAPAPTAGYVLTAIDDEEAEWQAPAIGSVVQFWEPDAPPVDPSDHDDEFTSGSLDAAWTQWDPGGIMTFTYDSDINMVEFQADGNGTARTCGIFRDIPSLDETAVTLYAKLNGTGRYERWGNMLFVAQDLETNPSTSDLFVCYGSIGVGTIGSPQVGYQPWTAWNTAGTFVTGSSAEGTMGMHMYVRMQLQWNPIAGQTLIDMGWSYDGVGYTHFAQTTISYKPLHFGVGLYTFENAMTFIARAEFVRARTEYAYGVLPGRLVSVGA